MIMKHGPVMILITQITIINYHTNTDCHLPWNQPIGLASPTFFTNLKDN